MTTASGTIYHTNSKLSGIHIQGCVCVVPGRGGEFDKWIGRLGLEGVFVLIIYAVRVLG